MSTDIYDRDEYNRYIDDIDILGEDAQMRGIPLRKYFIDEGLKEETIDALMEAWLKKPTEQQKKAQTMSRLETYLQSTFMLVFVLILFYIFLNNSSTPVIELLLTLLTISPFLIGVVCLFIYFNKGRDIRIPCNSNFFHYLFVNLLIVLHLYGAFYGFMKQDYFVLVFSCFIILPFVCYLVYHITRNTNVRNVWLNMYFLVHFVFWVTYFYRLT